jgi:amino acid adenylation domain-containing protein
MKGSLDAAVLERSLGEIVRRHESLRTTFAAVEGRPVQVIAPAPATGLELIDLTGLAEGERDSEVERLADEEARKSFDLSTGPLLRASLLKLSEEEHVLLFTMHHIVSDGWSMGVLVGELKALYEAYSSGKESPLPEPTAQYADFAHWQRRALEDGLLEPELDYWRAQLRGAQSVLAMPTDRPRPPVQTYNGAAESFHIDEELTRSLKRLSLESGATLFMTLLAAFDALLYRHTNQRDISVATPVAGRTSAETEGLIGLFVNTLVMRARLEGAQSFRELLASVRETALAAYVHQGVPFEKLVEDLQPERDTSHSPLVQVMFAMQNAPAHALELPGLSLELMQPASVAAKFELLLTMEESAEGLAGRLEYNTDLFDPETAAALVARFRTLLAGAAADPDTEVAALPLLTFEERRRVLLEFNRTQRDYERATLHGLFEAQAARTPEATALVAGRERLTYRELNERAERVARGLRASGVGAESLVGVCAGRTAALVAGLLGVLKSGGAYVPLDPQYPAERVALMLEDSRAKVLLTERRLRGTLPQTGARVLCLDEEWAEFDEVARDENAAAFHSDENLSHVIYTSGSTGRPKGVAIMHRSSATLVRWALDTFAAEDLRGVLASTSICFDLSVYELFVPLATGGTVILADHALALPTLEARGEVTLINTVPSAMTELLRARAVPEGVRVVNLAGEPLAAKLVEDVYTQTGVRDVFNLYGPTEDTTYSTGERVPEGGGAPSIGRPVANTSGYILDAHLRPVPVGVTGDLYLSGEGLARGYLRRPDMTAERFIPDPFSTEPGARMYRTGDLARYLRDGRIDFLGRADHQVKIRGFRIELGEIESALSRTEGVRDCCVVARDEASGSKRLVAYLVAEPGADVSNAALRLSLRKTLPEYMVPSVFVMLEELPLTPNGKVDRKALPAPGGARPDDDGAYTAPRTPTEELVANVWRALLGLERVSVTENFFELGGHSLLATQAVAKVGEAARTELPLLMMFESPTVEGFAAAVDKLTAEAGEKRRGPSLTKFSRDAYRAKAPAGRGVEIPEILKRKRTE